MAKVGRCFGSPYGKAACKGRPTPESYPKAACAAAPRARAPPRGNAVWIDSSLLRNTLTAVGGGAVVPNLPPFDCLCCVFCCASAMGCRPHALPKEGCQRAHAPIGGNPRALDLHQLLIPKPPRHALHSQTKQLPQPVHSANSPEPYATHSHHFRDKTTWGYHSPAIHPLPHAQLTLAYRPNSPCRSRALQTGH